MSKDYETAIENAIEDFKVNHHGVANITTVLSSHSPANALGIKRIMITRNLIKSSDNNHAEKFELTTDGWNFTTFEQERINKELVRQQMQSVIDTNRSVISTNNNMKVTSILTVFIVLATFVVSVLEYYKKESTKTPEALKELQTEIRELKECVKKLPITPLRIKIDSTK